MTRGSDTRARILTAAENVVLRDGVSRLTLESAAAEADLCKGGVLYHFPSRDSLVDGHARAADRGVQCGPARPHGTR